MAGYKFRRQQPIGPFIADFFCARARLVVELDGETRIGQEEKDAARQVYLESLGYRVLRFWNPDVYDELEAVMNAIWNACSCAG